VVSALRAATAPAATNVRHASALIVAHDLGKTYSTADAGQVTALKGLDRNPPDRSAPTMKRLHSLAGIFLAVGLTAANPAHAQQTLIPIKVGVLKIAGLANAYAAKVEKMFERNGLDATLIEFRSGAEAAAAQQAGAVDIALTIPGTAMTANERGFEFLAVFQNEIVNDQGPDSGSVQSLADSDIKSIKDLVGKRVATAQINGQQTIAAQFAMRKAGIDPAKVQLIEVPYPRHQDVLRTRQVDAVITTEPFTTMLLSSGTGRVLSWHYAEAMPGAPLGVWWAKKSYIEKNPDIVSRFNRSIKESIDYMNADAPRARQRTVEFTGLDPKLVQEMPPLRLDYNVRTVKWQQSIDMMIESKVIEKPHKATEYFSEPLKPYIKD
jgi:NitT/TauT family transport system substrate-binding protein